MFPFWVFKDNLETSANKPHVPLPENQKPLDFGMVFTSMEKVKVSDRLFVGEVVLVLDEKEGTGIYIVKSTDPLELVEIGERIETIQKAELEIMDEMEDPLRKYYKTVDDEMPDCGACDHYSDSSLCDVCGPEYGWAWYKRTLTPEEREDNESD